MNHSFLVCFKKTCDIDLNILQHFTVYNILQEWNEINIAATSDLELQTTGGHCKSG